jgi:antirestriction protein
MDKKVEDLIRLSKSTNAVAADIAKKKLADMGLDTSGNAIGGEEKKPVEKKVKEQKPKKEKSEKPKKAGRPADIKVSDKTDTITFKGKTYSLDDCEALFSAWKMKKKGAVKASEQSEARSTTEKVLDKAETTIKQIISDKGAKKKIKDNPKQAKRELVKVQKTMRAWLDAVEDFLGKKIPESKVKRVFSLLEEIELMENGGGLSYGDVYEGNLDEFAEGGEVNDTPKIYVADLAAYNNGMLVGEWLDLSDYDDGSEVMDAIQDLLSQWSEESGEEREEYAIHDYENFDSNLYSEYMGEETFDKVIKAYKLSEEKGVPMSVISHIITEYDPDDVEEWYDEHFEGEYNSDTDLAYGYIDMIGGMERLKQDTLEQYFDYEAFGRDLAYDYTEIDGFYFRTYKRGGEIKKYDLNKYVKK